MTLVMTIRERLRVPRRSHRLLTAVLLSAAALALSVAATPAGAIVATVGAHGYGVTPLMGVNPQSIAGAYRAPGSSGISGSIGALNFDESPNGGGPLIDHGGPVMASNTTHVIYWDPEGEFTATTKGIINKFFTDVAHDSGLASNVFGVDAQYGAAYSSTYAGELTDVDGYPSSGNCTNPGPPFTKCLYDSQLQTELAAYITAQSLPKGPTQLYFVLLPHKVVTCLGAGQCSNNVFCAYHSYIEPGTAGEIVYADIPFTLLDTGDAKGCQYDGNAGIQTPNGDTAGTNESTRFADVALKYISHEYSEAITDPLLNKWYDAKGLENGDKCNAWNAGPASVSGEDKHAFLPTLGGSAGGDNLFDQSINEDHYYLQSEWDNTTSTCLMQPALSASFTASPTSGHVGTPVTLNSTGADPYGALSFTWSFGDGGTGAGPSPSHTYAAPGDYTVTMTATDGLTGAMTVSHKMIVNDVPTASFTISPSSAAARAAVSFDGSGSNDPDGSIASYAWSFGDGGSGSGAAPSHSYATPGTYTATLTVTDIAGETNATSRQITVTAATGGSTTGGPATGGSTTVVISRSSNFSAIATPTANAATGAITFRMSVSDPGMFRWILTFQNGKFGAFSARIAHCKTAQVKLNGKCRPAVIVFGAGDRAVIAPGTVTFTVKPSASATKALKRALHEKKGLPVAVTLSFQSSWGGSSVSHTQSLDVRLDPFKGSGYGG